MEGCRKYLEGCRKYLEECRKYLEGCRKYFEGCLKIWKDISYISGSVKDHNNKELITIGKNEPS